MTVEESCENNFSVNGKSVTPSAPLYWVLNTVKNFSILLFYVDQLVSREKILTEKGTRKKRVGERIFLSGEDARERLSNERVKTFNLKEELLEEHINTRHVLPTTSFQSEKEGRGRERES